MRHGSRKSKKKELLSDENIKPCLATIPIIGPMSAGICGEIKPRKIHSNTTFY